MYIDVDIEVMIPDLVIVEVNDEPVAVNVEVYGTGTGTTVVSVTYEVVGGFPCVELSATRIFEIFETEELNSYPVDSDTRVIPDGDD